MNLRFAFLVALILIGGYFVVFNRKRRPGDKEAGLPGSPKNKDNPYAGLKSLAYATRYDQLNLEDPGDREILFGVMMDWDYEGIAIITLVAFKTGDASIYFSTGTGIIGAGLHPEVSKACKEFIDKAETFLPLAIKDSLLTTEKGVLKFYFLTNKAKYTIEDSIDKVTDHSSPLNTLFIEANKLIACIRVADEKSQQK
jgi:hypothetical protein